MTTVEVPAVDEPAPGTGRVIVLLALIACGSAMSMRVMDAAIPKLASDFHVTIRQAANVVTVFAVAYGCLQIVFGPSGDRFGKLQVILLACISGSLASVACALSSDFTLLLFARMWAGASMASMMPLSMAWIGDNVATAIVSRCSPGSSSARSAASRWARPRAASHRTCSAGGRRSSCSRCGSS